ncbi:MORN motif protein, partial (macronuclear) [Tetrahymena thermophila SB210]
KQAKFYYFFNSKPINYQWQNKQQISFCYFGLYKMYKSDQINQSLKKNYRYDFKNGIFEGNVVQYKRQGFGIAILDDGYIYIGYWHNDKVHGKALIFLPNIGVILANFSKGMQVGIQVVKLYKFSNEYFCVNIKDHLKVPKEVVIFSKLTNKSVQALIKNERQIEFKEIILSKEYEELIQQLDQFSMQFSSDFKITKCFSIDGDKQIKLGFVGGNHNRLNGLGLIIEQDSYKIIKQGLFDEDKLEGVGKLVMPNDDVYEGIFKNNQIDGQGFYFTAKTNSYIQGVFKKDVCKEFIQDGLEYPLNQIKKFKQQIHECSIHFYSSSFSARDFISINWNYLQDYMDKSKYMPIFVDGNSSSGLTSLLDKNQSTNNNFYRSDEYQQTFQANNQQINSSKLNTCQMISSSFNKYQPHITQRRSSSINEYRNQLPTYHHSRLNSLNVSQNFGKNGFLNSSNRTSQTQTSQKYSTKYTISYRDHQIENPEQQLSNSKINFGKLNWGQKPEASDLSFSYTNFNVNKEGQNLYDLLNNDETYQKESKINYFKNSGKIPSYQDTMQEGEIIKKRLNEMADFDNCNVSNNDSEKKILESVQQIKINSISQPVTYRSVNTTTPLQARQIERQQNSIDSQKMNRRFSNQNYTYNIEDNFQIKENTQDPTKIQSISDYLKNVAENNQESYLNQKIDSCDFRYNKNGRNLIPYNPNQYGKDFIRQGCETSQSDYSIQQYEAKKRSSSLTTPNTIVSVSKSSANCYDKRLEISPERVTLSIDKGLNSSNIQCALNQQINKNNENIIKLQNLYEDRLKRSDTNILEQEDSSKSEDIQKKQPQQPKKQQLNDQKQQNNSNQCQQLLSQSSLTQNNTQPMKFIKVLGVPHSNKSDQVGIFLKMKEEAIKQKELQTNSILEQQNSIQKIQEITPQIARNANKIASQNSLGVSILEQYMNPESCAIKKSDKNSQKQNKSYQFQANQNGNNNLENINKQNQINNGYYLPQEKNDQKPISPGNQNQSSMLSNNPYNQIQNEFEQNLQQIPKQQLDILQEQKIKLNSILYSRKQSYNNNQNLQDLPSARLSGYSVGITSQYDNKNIFNQNSNLNTLPINVRTQSTDNSPYNISKTNPNEIDDLEFKTKSMVRFNLNSDTPQRHSSFNYRRQQTPEKSSLKGSNKSHLNSNLSCTSNESDQKVSKRLSTSIDLSNSKYHYNENPVNLFYMNTLQKTQNQWLDLYSVNPQILANASPQKYQKSRQIQNNQQIQQQCLPQIA